MLSLFILTILQTRWDRKFSLGYGAVMPTPLTGDRRFRNTAIRVADLTVNSAVIEDYEFSNCRILGPAVLLMRDCTIVSPVFDGPGLDALFWEIPPTRSLVIGAIGSYSCTFSNCSFEGIGLAGSAEMREELEQALRDRD